MKRVLSIFIIFILLFIVVPQVEAQYNFSCPPCCPNSTRTCTQPNCGGSCRSVPPCTLAGPKNLRYAGTGTAQQITLSWDTDANATEYRVVITDVVTLTQLDSQTIPAPETSYTFFGTLGAVYKWTVVSKNNCYTSAISNGPNIGLPNPFSNGEVAVGPSGPGIGGVVNGFSNLFLAHGQAWACGNANCNGYDLIVGSDQDHDQIIPIRLTVYDHNVPTGSRLTDIQQINILFDNNSDYQDGSFYRLIYKDDGLGNRSFQEEPGNSGTLSDGFSVTNASFSADAGGEVLVLDFDLNVADLGEADAFLSNIYINVKDFSDITTGRIIKIGKSNFNNPPDDVYGTNAIEALDIWNGKDVAVQNVGFFQVGSYQEVCSQVGLPSSLNLDILAAPGGNNSETLTNWASTTYYQPYYHYQNANHNVVYSAPVDATYNLLGMSSEQYGGDCVGETNGNVVNTFKNGGLRAQDSGVGDKSLNTAFAVLSISEGWSQIIDGNLFSNKSLNLNIEPITCPSCYFTNVSKSLNNGLALTNGTFTSKSNNNFGAPKNWFSQTQSGRSPFTGLELPNYQELKDLYEESGYRELSGNQTTGTGDLAAVTPNTTYFIDGHLTVSSSTLLRVAQNSYLLFIVNGNLTITSSVKDSVVGNSSAIQAMFVVLDNGTGTGNITVEDDENDNDDDLTIEGALVASGNINFQRSLYINNNTRPAIKVVYRPDMLSAMKNNNAGIISVQRKIVN